FSAQPLFARALPPSPRLRRDKSKRGSVSLLIFRCYYFFNEGLKARVAVKRIEQGIYLDRTNVGAVALLVAVLEPAQRFILIIQAEIKQGAQVADHFVLLTYIVELAQHPPRGILVASVCFSHRPKRRHIRVVV